jgi:alpha-L-rhamnosidase
MSEPWEADWVAAAEDEKFHPVFRRIFRVPAGKEIVRARLYASAVGLFEPWLNGKKLGDELLTPYITNYETGIQVITFPAEERLLSGESNRLELYCGKGWYMGTFGLELQCNNYGDRMAAIAELYIEYADGSTDCIKTDSDWEVRGTDVEESGIYFGETVNHHAEPGKGQSLASRGSAAYCRCLCCARRPPGIASDTFRIGRIIWKTG